MTPAEQIMWGAIAAAGLAGSALCSGFETGAYTVDRLRLDSAAAHGDRAAKRLAQELARPSHLLATILVSNNIANYAGSLGIAALLAGAGLTDAAVIILNALLLTPVLLIFAEILPKEMFRSGSDRITTSIAPAARLARWCFTISAIVPALILFGRLVSKLTGSGLQEEFTGARHRIAALLQEGVRSGVLSEHQSGLIDRAIELRDATVTDLMRPWNEVPKLSESWNPAQAQQLATKQPRNRYILTDSAGKPTGAISAPALWALTDQTISNAKENIIRLAPDTTAPDALKALLDAAARVAIIERPGTPLGVVTVRSLIEPLTGELGALEV